MDALRRLKNEGIDVPSDLDCLYSCYDGVDPGTDLNQWQSNVFLQFDFRPAKSIVDHTLIAPKLNPANPKSAIKFSGISVGFGCQMDVLLEESGKTHVAATNFPSSTRTYVMFDSILSMLASVVLVQESGLLTYDSKGKVDYDIEKVWNIIEPLNPRANYWPGLLDQTLDWEIPGETYPDFSRSKWG